MKILLACEGKSEVYLINSLIDRGYLAFNCPLLLDEPQVLRQLYKIEPIINILDRDEEIIIYRIGDTLNEPLDFSSFKMREQYIKVHKVCTKRELEILVIINEKLYSDFLKCPKNTKPKSFINERLKDYNPESYFQNHDMMWAIKEYKRLKKHNKDEIYLCDFIELFHGGKV